MYIWFRSRGELLGTLLGEGSQVEAGSRQEILRLTDVHPEALKVERVELTVLGHRGESLLFNRGGSEIDSLEHARVENVDTGIDSVSDELNGLLDEAVDSRRVVWLVDNDTVFRWLLDLGDDNGSLLAVCLVEVCQLFEWVLADDIRVEDEEWGVVLAENLLGELQGTGGSKRLRLD